MVNYQKLLDCLTLIQGETDYLIRTLKGCILNTLGITATIGDVVKCTGVDDFFFIHSLKVLI